MTTTIEPEVTLEAHPAMMGWAIVASYGEHRYIVEFGLPTPDKRLAYWEKNKARIVAAIKRDGMTSNP